MLVLVLLSILVWWIGRSRNTDLADSTLGISSDFKEATSAEAPDLQFRDVARERGLIMRHGPGLRGRSLPEDNGSGLTWGDYDGDGDPDLYLVNYPGPLGSPSSPEGVNRLFRNDEGEFTDVTGEAGVGDLEGFGMGASFADYDGDGDLDLYVTNRGPNRLFRNRGDGTFEDVAEALGVDDPLWSTGIAWGDFNRDGRLDFYLCNYVNYDAEGFEPKPDATSATSYEAPYTLNPNSFDPQPNRLFQQQEDGTFKDVALELGVDNPDGRSFAATFVDLDGDGWLDLYVNNDVSTNRLYRNLGDASGLENSIIFEDFSTSSGTADPRGSMGLSVGEIGSMTGQEDGLPDLFITHWIAQENAFYQSLVTETGQLEYRDKTRLFRLGEIAIDRVGWGSVLGDFDLDGRLDIAVANGSTLEHKEAPLRLKEEPLFIFWNDGSRFYNLAPVSGSATAGQYNGRGLAAADFDGDGDLDLAISVNRGEPLLLLNETDTTHQSLTVSLLGTASTLFGARVQVVSGEISQTKWYGADVSFLGMHHSHLLFGLGPSSFADRVEVRFADGARRSIERVPPGQLIITHPQLSGAEALQGSP